MIPSFINILMYLAMASARANPKDLIPAGLKKPGKSSLINKSLKPSLLKLWPDTGHIRQDVFSSDKGKKPDICLIAVFLYNIIR
jgi:hypothetical protein